MGKTKINMFLNKLKRSILNILITFKLLSSYKALTIQKKSIVIFAKFKQLV